MRECEASVHGRWCRKQTCTEDLFRSDSGTEKYNLCFEWVVEPSIVSVGSPSDPVLDFENVFDIDLN